MNQVHEESKSALMKTFAVLGFVILIVFGAWLAIKVVTMIPSAFSSLASLADSVHNPGDKKMAIETDVADNTLSNQESFTLAWSDMKKAGIYAVNYDCVDGVALSVRMPDGSIEDVTCGEDFTMPQGVFSVDAAFSSEKARFSDVPYSISFTEAGEDEAMVAINKTLTIVNPSIPADGLAVVENTMEEGVSVVELGSPAPAIAIAAIDTGLRDEAPAVVATPAPAPKPTPKPTYIEVPTLEVPVSDANGYAELAVSFVRAGVISGVNGFQFKVTNTGTKDSAVWSFGATLPSGTNYVSGVQSSLKVNESAIITVGFDDDSAGTYGVAIAGGNDTNTNNNSFTRVASN